MSEQEEFEFRLRLEREQRATSQPSALRRGLEASVGPYEAGLNLATGTLGAAAGGLAGLAQGVKNLVSPGMSAADRVSQVQSAMTYQPRTEAGKQVTGMASYPFEKLGEGAQWAGGKVTDITGSPALGAAINTAIQSAPMAIGAFKGPLAKAKASAESIAAPENALNAPKAADIAKAREIGLVLSPAEANPSIINRVMEGFSGQSKTQLLASTKNQPILNALVRKGLGIAEDTPITVPVLEEVRKNAGQAYDAVRKVGTIVTDEQYGKALRDITAKYEGAERDFPGMAKSDVADAVKSAQVGKFDASSGIDAIKIQRGMADKAFRQGDMELGKAHKAIADAIEGQIDRSLGAGGGVNLGAVQDFRKARQIIAKSYDVQQALKGNDVDARVLAAQLKKGRPLSGEVLQAAEFAQRFPGAAQTGGRNAYVPGMWDFGLGGLGGIAAHTVLGAGLTPVAAATMGAAASRPLVRGLITSPIYQKMMVNPPLKTPGIGLSLADFLARYPQTGALLPALANRQQQ